MFSFIVLKFSLASHFHSTLKVIYLFKKLVLSVNKFSCVNKVHWPCTSIVFVSGFLSLNCGQVTAAEYIFSFLKWLFPFQLTYVQLGSSSKDQNFQNQEIYRFIFLNQCITYNKYFLWKMCKESECLCPPQQIKTFKVWHYLWEPAVHYP